MPLGKEVGLVPGHIVLDGDPVGIQPPQQPLPTFGPCLLWPNGRPSQQLLSSCMKTNARNAEKKLMSRYNVCQCVTSPCSIETTDRIELIFGTEAVFGLLYIVF